MGPVLPHTPTLSSRREEVKDEYCGEGRALDDKNKDVVSTVCPAANLGRMGPPKEASYGLKRPFACDRPPVLVHVT